ncbi:MAG: hypothetical protein IT245_07385, partial [Bacteroidia bacterium]|nr:hypothetical protein [Bacteroidia bacterium]
MKEEKQDIDELLNQVLGNCEMDADGIDWAAFNQKKSKKKRFIWWFFGAAACLLLSIGIYSYLSFQTSENNNSIVQTNRTENSVNANNNQIPQNPSTTSKESTNILNSNKHSSTQQKQLKKEGIRQIKPIETNPYQDFKPLLSNLPIDSIQNSELLPILTEQVFSDNLEEQFRSSSIHPIPYFGFPLNSPSEIRHKTLKIKQNGKNLFEIGFSGFVFTNSLKIMDIGKAFIHKDYAAIRTSSEKPDGAFDFRIGFGRKIAKFDFLIGLGYSRRNMTGNYHFNYSEKPLIDADGKIIGYDINTPKLIQYTSHQRFNFIEIPIQMRYEIIRFTNNQRIKLHLGFVPQFLKGIGG